MTTRIQLVGGCGHGRFVNFGGRTIIYHAEAASNKSVETENGVIKILPTRWIIGNSYHLVELMDSDGEPLRVYLAEGYPLFKSLLASAQCPG